MASVMLAHPTFDVVLPTGVGKSIRPNTYIHEFKICVVRCSKFVLSVVYKNADFACKMSVHHDSCT